MIDKNKYKGKLFSVLGDSISTLAGVSEPQDAVFYEGMNKLLSSVFCASDTWWGQVIEYFGGKLLVNNSFSGSMTAKHPKCIIPSYSCSDERTSALSRGESSPDVIMVFMGTNDWGSGAVLEPRNENEKDNISIFSVAYKEMLKKLKNNYPRAEIWCFTLCPSGYKNGEKIEFPYIYSGKHMKKYCKVIEQCARQSGCILVDLYNTVEPFDTIDGFHPNAKGMSAISRGAILATESI